MPLSSSPRIAAVIGTSNPPTRITHPSSVARLISSPVSRSRIALCRYNGTWSLYLATTVSRITRSLTRLLSMIRAGNGAATTGATSQCLQARFSRLVTVTKYRAGSTSKCSLVS